MIDGIGHTCFVLGCQRSGTTLTGHVLGAPADTVLFDEADGLYGWYHGDRSSCDAILCKSMAKYRDPAGRFSSGTDGRVRLADSVRTLVLKAPNLTYDIRQITQLDVPFSIVFPVRDPRAVVASMLRLKTIDFAGNQARLLQQSDGAEEFRDDIAFLANEDNPPWERLALVWRIKTGFHRQCSALQPSSYVFRYEDLVSDPRRILGELTKTTGLPFQGDMLDHQLVYQGRSQGKFDSARPIDPRSVQSWTEALSAPQAASVKDIAGDLMQRFDYD